MFNRSYQLRAVRKAGGGQQAAAELALDLPWAGIFEPWRPFVLVAELAKNVSLKSHSGGNLKAHKPAVRPQIAAKRCKKGCGRLQGVQLELFADIGAQKFTGCENIDTPLKNFAPESGRLQFPPLAGMEVPLNDDDRPLADLFPEAYL